MNEARFYFAVIIASLAAMLLFTVAAVRDQSVIDHYQPRFDPVECVAENSALGKPYIVAVENCAALSELTPGELEVALP